MITSKLRTNQLSKSAYDAYLSYLSVLDDKDIDGYAEFLADDVAIQFGNAPAIEGKKAVVEMLGGYWQSFKSIEHDLLNIYGTDETYVLEALNHYERHDGKKISVRAVAFTDRNDDGLVKSVRIFGDTSPLFES